MVLKLLILLMFMLLQKRALSVDKVIFLCFIRPVFCASEELGDEQKTVGVEMCFYTFDVLLQFSCVRHLQKFTAKMSCVRPS